MHRAYPRNYCLLLCVSLACVYQPARHALAEEDMRYDGTDIAGIENLVDAIENHQEPWLREAMRRIEKHRKKPLTLQLADQAGNPVRGADVHVRLVRHAFPFGSVVRSHQLVGKDPGVDPEVYRRAFLGFGFNLAGFENALKYKLGKALAANADEVLPWFSEHNIPVRGHVLI